MIHISPPDREKVKTWVQSVFYCILCPYIKFRKKRERDRFKLRLVQLNPYSRHHILFTSGTLCTLSVEKGENKFAKTYRLFFIFGEIKTIKKKCALKPKTFLRFHQNLHTEKYVDKSHMTNLIAV